MFFVAMVMVPIVIGYQLWSYSIFKNKIHKDSAKDITKIKDTSFEVSFIRMIFDKMLYF